MRKEGEEKGNKQKRNVDKKENMTYFRFSELQKSMQQLLKEKVSTDVSFKVTDSDTLVVFLFLFFKF